MFSFFLFSFGPHRVFDLSRKSLDASWACRSSSTFCIVCTHLTWFCFFSWCCFSQKCDSFFKRPILWLSSEHDLFNFVAACALRDLFRLDGLILLWIYWGFVWYLFCECIFSSFSNDGLKCCICKINYWLAASTIIIFKCGTKITIICPIQYKEYNPISELIINISYYYVYRKSLLSQV